MMSNASCTVCRLRFHPISASVVAMLFVLAPCAAADVFVRPPRQHDVSGTVTTSDGKALWGLLYINLGKPLKIYDPRKRKFVEFTLKEVSRIDIEVEIEKEQPYWYWKESGSDDKVYTGKSYIWRKYRTSVTFSGGEKVSGYLSGIIYLEDRERKKHRFILHDRHKGKPGEPAEKLIYVKSIVAGDQPPAENIPDKDAAEETAPPEKESLPKPDANSGGAKTAKAEEKPVVPDEVSPPKQDEAGKAQNR